MPLFTDAYLADTRHLTTIQHGAYLLLLMVAWRTRDGTLPNDDAVLARYAGLTRAQWGRMKPTLMAFFELENGQLVQKRLRDEYAFVRQKRESAAANGRASALKRKGRHSTKRERSVNETATPTPTPTSVDKSTAGKPAPDPVKVLFDLGVEILMGAGQTEAKARSLIGKWRKEQRDDAKVLAAFIEARGKSVSEPVEWLTKRLAKASFVSDSGYEYRGSLEQIRREAEKRNDMGTYWRVQGLLRDK